MGGLAQDNPSVAVKSSDSSHQRMNRAVIPIGAGRHDRGNDDAEEVVTLADFGRISRLPQKACTKETAENE